MSRRRPLTRPATRRPRRPRCVACGRLLDCLDAALFMLCPGCLTLTFRTRSAVTLARGRRAVAVAAADLGPER